MVALTIKAIVAADEGGVIGSKNSLPWHIPEDLKHFAALTKGNTVLMGRSTYESLPAKFRPLPGRLNVVISRTLTSVPEPGVLVFSSPEEALSRLAEGQVSLPSSTVWVIGGEQLYRSTKALWQEIHLTRIKGRHEGDAFFPAIDEEFSLAEAEQFPAFRFERYVRGPHGGGKGGPLRSV